MYFSPQFVAVGTPVSVSRTGTPCISTFFSTICTRDDSSVLRPEYLSRFECPGPSGPQGFLRCPNTRRTTCPGPSGIQRNRRVFHGLPLQMWVPNGISRTDTSLCHSLSQHSELHDAEFFHHFPGGLVLFRFSCFHGGHTTSNIIQLILFAFSGHF